MKKLYILLAFFLLFNGYEESNDISIELTRDNNDNILIVWNVEVENAGRVYLFVEQNNSIDEYELPSLFGQINLCCYPSDVNIKIIVHVTKAIQISDDECDAIECVEFIKFEYFNEELSHGTTTTTITTTSTTSTTTTTIPPPTTTTTISIPLVEHINFFDIEITNPLITSIPQFEDIDFKDQEKNSMSLIISTGIIVLFYLILLLQEWFSKVVSTHSIPWLYNDKDFSSSNKVNNTIQILITLILTSFLIGYVEEGADLIFDLENLAVFIASFVGLLIVTISYEGLEGYIERKYFNSLVYYRWVPQAILFALISTLSFILFQMPIGFVFGFIAGSYIVSNREKATLSPKFFSSIMLSGIGFLFFYLTSVPFIYETGVLSAIFSLTYLMCLEGVLFKSLPGGGNELFESINDSDGLFKVFPLVSFTISVWLFIRILIIPPDSEFATFHQDILNMGSFSYTFALILITYAVGILLFGIGIKRFGSNEK